jgi:uncharacterized protein
MTLGARTRSPSPIVVGVATCVVVATIVLVPASSAFAARPSLLPFEGHGSIDAAYVLGATAGSQLNLVDGAGRKVGTGTVDRLGSLIVRNLRPGSGYRFEEGAGGRRRYTAPFRVLSTSPPPQSFYSSQQMHVGLNYIEMRDGVLLAATVRLPPGDTLADGPFPTVIEWSGYAVAAPHSLIDALEGKASLDDPLLPDTSTIVGSVIAPLLGFATVSLQMRGTGCSGGAFDLFGLDSDYDAYDAIQIVGSQPWVLKHKVGMVGISYSGFSQLIAAGTDPPDLAAITPLSPTDDLYSTGYPGGIYNDGFAASWIAQRKSDAQPAPGGGQPWATAEIDAGDKTCLANQALHLQAQNQEALVTPDLARVPSLFDPRSPVDWARHITVPVFLAGALEDEEVGPQWPALIDALKDDPHVFVTMTNGTHIDSLGPDIISDWLEFLDIYVAGRVPTSAPLLSFIANAVYGEATGAPAASPPAIRFTTEPSVTAAAAAFVAHTPRVRVLFDNGGGSLGPGALQPTYEAGFTAWPPRGRIVRYNLGPDGELVSGRLHASSTASFRPNPSVRPPDDLPSGNPWAAQPPYDWTTVPAANGIAFQTPAFTRDTTVVGPASLDLELESTADVTDLQVTVTEVYPGDKQEEYVTSGYLRSSDRALSAASTALDPVPTYLGSERRNLPPGRFTLVRIPVDPIATTFRPGTSLRIVISAPGGDRPAWQFDTPATHNSVVDTVALRGVRGSSFVVNEVAGVDATQSLPSCGSLRGEPCRAYSPLGNQT